ncbi:MAG: hypothetical protein ABJL99_24100 [Aliishimia sp.]
MMFSANEVQMLAQKAARGAGAYPAQAAHFGRVVAYHLTANRSADALSSALDALPSGPIQTLPVTTDESDVCALATSYREALLPAQQRPDLPARLLCPEALLSQMQKLAHKTYVPSSQGSRASGAGAGLTDND